MCAYKCVCVENFSCHELILKWLLRVAVVLFFYTEKIIGLFVQLRKWGREGGGVTSEWNHKVRGNLILSVKTRTQLPSKQQAGKGDSYCSCSVFPARAAVLRLWVSWKKLYIEDIRGRTYLIGLWLNIFMISQAKMICYGPSMVSPLPPLSTYFNLHFPWNCQLTWS